MFCDYIVKALIVMHVHRRNEFKAIMKSLIPSFLAFIEAQFLL